jgi:hypothetical protein
VLVGGRHREVAEHEHEHEDVVDGERVLDEVPGEKFERGLPGRGVDVEPRPGQPRVGREHASRDEVQRHVEAQTQRDPHRDPHARLAEADRLRLLVEEPEVHGQETEHAGREEAVEPPVILEGKERHERP